MRRIDMLRFSAGVREALLQNYQNQGTDAGRELMRRYLHEIGEVAAQVHGRKEAAAMLYAAADACTGGLKVEDWRLLALPPAPVNGPQAVASVPPTEDQRPSARFGRALGRGMASIWNAVTDRFFIGVICGLYFGGQR